jgi:hypothetical protein
MQSNLVLVARFVPNPFLPVKGSFAGLFWNTNGVRPADSGRFTLTLASAGSFSGKLVLGLRAYSFTGTFNVRGTTTVTIARAGLSSLRLALAVDLAQGSDQVLGTLTDGAWISVVQGHRNVFTSAKPAPQAGSCSVELLTTDNAPRVAATGSAQISATGIVKVAGKLADGRAFSSSATLAKNGDYPFHVVLSSGNEVQLGWMKFPSPGAATGTVVWTATGTNSFSTTLELAPIGP